MGLILLLFGSLFVKRLISCGVVEPTSVNYSEILLEALEARVGVWWIGKKGLIARSLQDPTGSR